MLAEDEIVRNIRDPNSFVTPVRIVGISGSSAFQKSTILVNSGLAAKAKWSRLEFYMLNAGTLG